MPDQTLPPPDPASALLFTLLAILLAFFTAWLSVQAWRIYSTRGYYLADFTRCSFEARELWMETAAVRGLVEQYKRREEGRTLKVVGNWKKHEEAEDEDAGRDEVRVGREDEEVVSQAEDLDTVIRLALGKWEDVMQPDEDGLSETEVEAGSGDRKGDKLLSRRRKRHGRFMIGLMRRECFEGLERRRALSGALGLLERVLLGR